MTVMSHSAARTISEWRSTPLGPWDYFGCGIAWIFIPIILVCGPILAIVSCILMIVILALPSWCCYAFTCLFRHNTSRYFASLNPDELSRLEICYLKDIEGKRSGEISVQHSSVQLDVILDRSSCWVVEHSDNETSASITLNVIKASLLACPTKKTRADTSGRQTILFIHGIDLILCCAHIFNLFEYEC